MTKQVNRSYDVRASTPELEADDPGDDQYDLLTDPDFRAQMIESREFDPIYSAWRAAIGDFFDGEEECTVCTILYFPTFEGDDICPNCHKTTPECSFNRQAAEHAGKPWPPIDTSA